MTCQVPLNDLKVGDYFTVEEPSENFVGPLYTKLKDGKVLMGFFLVFDNETKSKLVGDKVFKWEDKK